MHLRTNSSNEHKEMIQLYASGPLEGQSDPRRAHPSPQNTNLVGEEWPALCIRFIWRSRWPKTVPVEPTKTQAWLGKNTPSRFMHQDHLKVKATRDKPTRDQAWSYTQENVEFASTIANQADLPSNTLRISQTLKASLQWSCSWLQNKMCLFVPPGASQAFRSTL